MGRYMMCEAATPSSTQAKLDVIEILPWKGIIISEGTRMWIIQFGSGNKT